MKKREIVNVEKALAKKVNGHLNNINKRYQHLKSRPGWKQLNPTKRAQRKNGAFGWGKTGWQACPSSAGAACRRRTGRLPNETGASPSKGRHQLKREQRNLWTAGQLSHTDRKAGAKDLMKRKIIREFFTAHSRAKRKESRRNQS